MMAGGNKGRDKAGGTRIDATAGIFGALAGFFQEPKIPIGFADVGVVGKTLGICCCCCGGGSGVGHVTLENRRGLLVMCILSPAREERPNQLGVKGTRQY
jgi:hypothetical protein